MRNLLSKLSNSIQILTGNPSTYNFASNYASGVDARLRVRTFLTLLRSESCLIEAGRHDANSRERHPFAFAELVVRGVLLRLMVPLLRLKRSMVVAPLLLTDRAEVIVLELADDRAEVME